MVDEKYTICPWHEYGRHIVLRCRNHPELQWTTKNINNIGARHIFFEGATRECECKLSELYHTCKDSEDYKRLENN